MRTNKDKNANEITIDARKGEYSRSEELYRTMSWGVLYV